MGDPRPGDINKVGGLLGNTAPDPTDNGKVELLGNTSRDGRGGPVWVVEQPWD